jgi:hypothetical protein
MQVRLFPNSIRPGVGLKPRRESQRPLLPQHARHCPVLEAGSAMGFLVYPALEPNESFAIEYQGEGRYQFTYFRERQGGQWQAIVAVTFGLPMGSIGMMKEDVTFVRREPAMSRDEVLRLARALFVPEDLGTPPGAVTLRGTTNFQTPEGWDTVYTPIFNMIERPVAPMLIVRVETDWYPHDSEFRYVLQPGEAIPGAHNLPIGQVVFVPREEITFRDASKEEAEERQRAREEFFREKATHRVSTPHGLHYSPHYLRQSRARKS